MAVPAHLADKILVRCARHCCVCRRFRPLLLQVHHIRERGEGGGDEEDNLICTCISCHAEVHTETKLTRRFTERELKMHRDEVYRLVAEGKLPSVQNHDDRVDVLTASLLNHLGRPTATPARQQLLPEAIEILCAAANGTGDVIAVPHDGGFSVLAGGQSMSYHDARKSAALRRSMEQLVGLRLIDHDRDKLYHVSIEGYQLADNLLSMESTQS